jgi:hypothetical protein
MPAPIVTTLDEAQRVIDQLWDQLDQLTVDRLVLTSPNGKAWKIVVSDAGALSAVAL